MNALRSSEYPTWLADALAELANEMDQARLPLHILLDTHFGDLNENQEEMLGAAQRAVEQADMRVRQLRELIDLDRGTLELRRDAIPTGDFIASLLPSLQAAAKARDIRITTEFAPALPRIIGDRARLQRACTLLLTERLHRTPNGYVFLVMVEPAGPVVHIEVMHGGTSHMGIDEVFARRFIIASGGEVSENGGRTTLLLPTQPSTLPH